MGELNRHVDNDTQILFGTAVDGRMGNRLAVTIISSLAADGEVVAKPIYQQPATVLPISPPAEPVVVHAKWPVAPEPVVPAAEEMFAEEELTPIAPPEPERPLKTIEAILPASDPVEDELIAAGAFEPEPVESRPAPAPPQAPAPAPAMIQSEPAQPRVILPKKKPSALEKPAKPEKVVAKQEVLQFESVTRGRFEKSEPTIVEGQDLDVPTFLRKNVRVK
jgi:cell division protein FtsZ